MRFLQFFLIVVSACLSISAQTVDFSELEKTIAAELQAAKTPGAAFAVISGERVVFAKGFGTTSTEGGNPVTTETLFRMGSTTKMFTAATLVSLAEAGKLKMDSPLGTYLKELPPKISALTPHQLLSQSSGLRDFAPTVFSNDDAALGQNIRLWKEDIFFTAPNRIYSYSSANFWLAGFLTEQIYGKSYPDAVADLILRPLGMTRSTIRPTEAMTYPLALGHDIKNGTAAVVRPIDNNAAKYPGGSMYSSVDELSRWAVAMLGGGKIDGKQVLPSSLVENLMKPQFYLPGEEKAFYGYGLLGFTDRGIRTVSHGGVSRGYGSTIFFAPDQKIAIIVLTNSNGQTLPKSRQKAMEMLLPLKSPATDQPKTTALTAVELKRYEGKFTHAPQTWEIFGKDGKLFVREDGKEFELKPAGQNEFEYEQGGVLFVPNEKGEFEHIFMGLYAARRAQ
jgi:CubicO group peptidase (beta-lactamase class C family)